MKNFTKKIGTFLIIFVLGLCSYSTTAQEDKDLALEKAKKEITETFGTFPSFFDAFPEYALPGAWQAFKELQSPGHIDAKNRELIGLAVASQIPCAYCVYFHTLSAKAHGATDEEIKEAIAFAGSIRNWSTVIHGNQIDLEDFKKEFDKMLDYMTNKANTN